MNKWILKGYSKVRVKHGSGIKNDERYIYKCPKCSLEMLVFAGAQLPQRCLKCRAVNIAPVRFMYEGEQINAGKRINKSQ